MWANRKYPPTNPRTACLIVTTEESIRPRSPRPRRVGSTWARWIPTKGSSPLDSHRENHSRSWWA